MKISKKNLTCIAFAFLFLPVCAKPFAKIQGDALIAEGCAIPQSESFASKRNAEENAQTDAYMNVLKYAISESLEIPEIFKPLKDDILERAFVSYAPLAFKLESVKVLEKSSTNERAVCRISVPLFNLKDMNFKVKSAPEDYILSFTATSPVLAYELNSIAKKSPDTALLCNYELGQILDGKKISQLNDFLLNPRENISPENLKNINANALVFALGKCYADDITAKPIIAELKKRNYINTAKFFENLSLKADENTGESLHIKSFANAAQKEALEYNIPLFDLLIKAGGNLKICESKDFSNNPKLIEARKYFSQNPPDLRAALSASILSLDSISSEAFNLSGRSLELLDKKYLAMYCYLQSYNLDKKNPYAAGNLALLLSALKEDKLAKTWSDKALKNENISSWSKNKLLETFKSNP